MTIRRMSRLMILLGVLAMGFSPLRAGAASFDVSARIFCPASWLVGPNLPDPTFMTAVPLPCARIRVVAMDSDPGFDEYCGAAFTDARGNVPVRDRCRSKAMSRVC